MDINMEEFAYVVSLIVSGVAFIASILSAVIAARGNVRASTANRAVDVFLMNQRRKDEKEMIMRKYQEPLFRSAADLQSRIYNIIAGGFFNVYYLQGNERQREYALDNTIFLFAQFYAWTEATRCEIQFISLDSDVDTRKLSKLQNDIHHLMQTDKFDRRLMIFAGEQRAIGEKMLKTSANGVACIGYGEYLDSGIQKNYPLLKSFSEEIECLAKGTNGDYYRLQSVQHALIDLLNFLDPEYVRFPKEQRSKV